MKIKGKWNLPVIICLISAFNLCQSHEISRAPDFLNNSKENNPPEVPSDDTRNDEQSNSPESSVDDSVCLKCYDKVGLARSMIAKHMNMLEKQKNLIQEKSKAISEQQTPPRSETDIKQYDTIRATTTRSSDSEARRAHGRAGLIKKDPELRRLKQDQRQQLNITCKTLLLIQECLGEISKECIGNLQFHLLEVYSNQWHSKLNCPYRNNPNLRVFPGLRSTYIQEEDAARDKIPVPRRITSNEEIRSRLHQMFPNGFGRPLGVMLKPTPGLPNAKEILALEDHRMAQSNYLRSLAKEQPMGQDKNSSKQEGTDFYLKFLPFLVPCCIAMEFAVVALVVLYRMRLKAKKPCMTLSCLDRV